MRLTDVSPIHGRVAPAQLGRAGERRAAWHYRLRFYRLIARNLRYDCGEIDLVFRRGRTLVFVEVKTRQQRHAGEPWEAVDREKQLRILRAAERFCRERSLTDLRIRFDVVAIYWDGKRLKLERFENAFQVETMPGVPWRWE